MLSILASDSKGCREKEASATSCSHMKIHSIWISYFSSTAIGLVSRFLFPHLALKLPYCTVQFKSHGGVLLAMPIWLQDDSF